MDKITIIICFIAVLVLIENIVFRVRYRRKQMQYKSEFETRHYKFSANTIQGQLIAVINNYRQDHELPILITDKLLTSRATRLSNSFESDRVKDTCNYYTLYASGFTTPEDVLAYWLRHSLERDILQDPELEWIGSAVKINGNTREYLILVI